MRVRMINTGEVKEYEDGYAVRLIEQGAAVPVDDAAPITPTPVPLDPSQYGPLIEALETRCAALEAEIAAMKQEATDTNVFANMYQSVAQAQERQLEYLEEHLQEEIDAATGNEG